MKVRHQFRFTKRAGEALAAAGVTELNITDRLPADAIALKGDLVRFSPKESVPSVEVRNRMFKWHSADEVEVVTLFGLPGNAKVNEGCKTQPQRRPIRATASALPRPVVRRQALRDLFPVSSPIT